MTTPIYLSGFEYGVLATNGGGLFNSVNGTPGTHILVQSSIKRTGSYALKCAPTGASSGAATKNFSGSPTQIACRLYFYIETAPASAIRILTFTTTTSANTPRLTLNTSNGKIELRAGSTVVAIGPTYTTGVWYQLDWLIDVSANPWTMSASINNGAEFSGPFTQAADTFASFTFGLTVAVAYSVIFDDVIISATAADYPIGPGQVLALSPNADGTHSPSTPDCIRGGGASPSLISGSNTAYQYLDDLPFPSGTSPTTDRINQDITSGHTTHYVEVLFADTTQEIINGAVGLLAYGGDSATANNGSTIVVRSDSTEIEIYGSSSTPQDMSETSVFFKSAIITAPGGGWTSTEINALVMRLGYSGDVTPNPYWQALLIEVDYTLPTAPPPFQRRTHVRKI